jgi:hypothetical protein
MFTDTAAQLGTPRAVANQVFKCRGRHPNQVIETSSSSILGFLLLVGLILPDRKIVPRVSADLLAPASRPGSFVLGGGAFLGRAEGFARTEPWCPLYIHAARFP